MPHFAAMNPCAPVPIAMCSQIMSRKFYRVHCIAIFLISLSVLVNILFIVMFRTLLSTSSYVLFTLDKLIFRLVKQMQTLVTDDVSVKIWELYDYEKARRFPPTDVLYHSNCRVILCDENCFRIERDMDRQLTITMMDAPYPESGTGILKPGITEYLRSFLGESPAVTEEDEAYTPIYLRRNLMPDGQQQRLSECIIDNGLECKLLCESSKLIYIQDTEDILIRRKRSRGSASVQASRTRRQAAFQRWLESKRPMQMFSPDRPLTAEQNGKSL